MATESSDGHGDEPPETDPDGPSGGASPLVFLVGLLVFLGSLVTFVADLVTGHDVSRSLVANAGGVVVLVVWAAVDTLSDPESSVATRRGAAGTALLLVGLYLVAGAIIVGVTSFVHDQLRLAGWYLGGGIGLSLVGFAVLPRERILDAETQEADATTQAGDETADDGRELTDDVAANGESTDDSTDEEGSTDDTTDEEESTDDATVDGDEGPAADEATGEEETG